MLHKQTAASSRTVRIMWIAGWLMGLLVMAGTTASAAPPVLSNLIVSPTVFDLDDALPLVTIAEMRWATEMRLLTVHQVRRGQITIRYFAH